MAHPRATKPVLSWVKTNELRAKRAGSKDINCPRLQIHCTARKQVTMRSNKRGGTEYFTSVAIIVLLQLALILAFISETLGYWAMGIEPGLLILNLFIYF